jgi:HK97 gp10 family phage protein
MSEFKLDIDGLEEVKRKLLAMPEKARSKVLRKAAKAGAEILEAEVKHRAPKLANPKHPEYGHLKDQIKIRVSTGKTYIAARVSTGDAFWARFLEYGSGKPKDPYDPDNPGKHAFMRPALDYKGEDAANAAADIVEEHLAELI